MFGNAFLIAPVFTKNNSRTIYLPKGTWYDFKNQSIEYKGPVTFTQNVPGTDIPVYIKGNSIFVTGQIYRGNSRIWENTLGEEKKIVIHLFPGQIDEQTTFNYVDYCDQDREKTMVLDHQNGKMIFTSEPLGTIASIELKCTVKPARIEFNNMPLPFKYDEKKNIASVPIEKNKSVYLEIFTAR
jgi:alpha-glucosidase (family GH31 glycosyl hydrolase)